MEEFAPAFVSFRKMMDDLHMNLDQFDVDSACESDYVVRPHQKPAVILDLDHTLIFASATPRGYSDFVVNVRDEMGSAQFHVFKRPGIDEFLTALVEIATVYLFTLGSSEYAHAMVRYLDPFCDRFAGVYTRNDCTFTGARWMKDYAKCGTDMHRTIVIDDDAAYFDGISKGIAVKPFFGEPGDQELQALFPKIIRAMVDCYRY